MFSNLRRFQYDAIDDAEDSGGMDDSFVATADASGAQALPNISDDSDSSGSSSGSNIFGTMMADLSGKKKGNPVQSFLQNMIPTIKTSNAIDTKSIMMLVGGLILVVFVFFGMSKKR